MTYKSNLVIFALNFFISFVRTLSYKKIITKKPKLTIAIIYISPFLLAGAFIYGSQRALCRITEIINEQKTDELENLVKPNVRNYIELLIQKKKLTKLQLEMIRLKPEDIKLLIPLRVRFERAAEVSGMGGEMGDVGGGSSRMTNEILCKIFLKSLAMKWFKYQDNFKLVLVVIESEFERKYEMRNERTKKGQILAVEEGERRKEEEERNSSDWIIGEFEVKQCTMLTGS